MSLRYLSLLWKIWLSTAAVLTGLFVLTGYILQRGVLETASKSMEAEAMASLEAYDSLWQTRALNLRTAASILSRFPGVDASRLPEMLSPEWIQKRLLSQEPKEEDTFFELADPEGKAWPVVARVRGRFPEQVTGFLLHGSDLLQVSLTPIYLEADDSKPLTGVLVAGYTVNPATARNLKEVTGKSEFVFAGPGRVFASTLDDRATSALVGELLKRSRAEGRAEDSRHVVSDGEREYLPLERELLDLEGNRVGRLTILRSFDAAQQAIALLRWRILMVWIVAVSAALGLTYLLVRRMMKPLRDLDYAALQVANQNYDYRVPVTSDDEFGRLAASFNSMCDSLQAARAELIRRERISTIGRLASSIVHDLRNPLAAIYGGAEVLADTPVTVERTVRLANNIRKSCKRIQDLLEDLVNVTRGKTGYTEVHGLREIVVGAVDPLRNTAEVQKVQLSVNVPDRIQLAADRGRLGGVFSNLCNNALEMMPSGGEIRITATAHGGWVQVEVADTGPGISGAVRAQLFEPFVSHGKKNGLGLGLALARQTVLDHGGDLWLGPDQETGGARFCLRLPLVSSKTS